MPGVPFDPPASGTSLLVRGPSMTGKFDLLLQTLGAAERAVLVSTGTSADRVRQDFANYGDPTRLGVVDCVTHESHRETSDGGVRYASSPRNLTELGVKFTDLMETVADERGVVGVHSLSELLMYWEPQRVYQFLRVLLGQVNERGWGTVAVLDDAACDDQTVHVLTGPFDVVVDTRSRDGTRELRVQRTGAVDVAWTPF